MKTKLLLRILGMLQIVVAIGAIPAGLAMIIDTSGSSLRMSAGMLHNSPFNTFLIPGVFLFVVNGLLNVVASVLSFKQHAQAAVWALALGNFLIVWIIIQVYFIGFIHILQPLLLIIGIIEVVLGFFVFRRIIS